jgi:chromosome partitioning protein
MARVIAVANLKGGTGKSTTVANLAAAWGAGSPPYRVLVIDLDPQGDLTAMFGRYPEDCPGTVDDLFVDADRELASVIETNVADGVDLMAAAPRLANVELTLAGQMGAEFFLKDALEGQVDTYDVVVIDCPPQLGKLTPNALFAASEVVIPVSMTDRGAYNGAAELLSKVDQVNKRQRLRVAAIVRTLTDPKRRAYRALDAELAQLGVPIARAAIPLRAAFHDAGVVGSPVVVSGRWTVGGVAYVQLAEELAEAAPQRSAA